MATKYLVASGADGVTSFATITAWLTSLPSTLTAFEELEVPNASFDIATEAAGGLFTALAAKVTTAAFYLRIYATPANSHDGRPRALSGTGARFTSPASSFVWKQSNSFMRLEGIELYGSSSTYALDMDYTYASGSAIKVLNCLVHDEVTGTGYTAKMIGANLNADVSGTIFYGSQRTWDTRGATSVVGVNVLAWRHAAELGAVSGSELSLKDSYSGHTGAAQEDYWSGGTPTGNNNASSDTTATARFTSSLNSIAGSAAFVSVTPGAEDFNLKAGTNALVDAGVAVTGRTADAAGTTIPQGASPDIGALERVVQTVPGAPTIGTATAGLTSASITFTAPASNGGSAITGYTATWSGGGSQAGASSPIVITGLTAGVAGTITVTATNAIGTSAASSASNSVTPTAAVPAPTGIITSVVADGSTVTISGTTTNTPTSGLATITAGSGGAVTQGPTAITLGAGTFTITFTGVVAGTYSGETVSVTNAGGTASATGSAAFTIVAVSGSPESPPPVDGNAYPTAPGTIANIGGIVGVAIAPVNVSAVFADGDALTYSASPAGTAWPAGLVINSATGIISGTVAAVSTTAGLKVRATDTVTQAVDSNAFTVTIAAVVVAAPYVAGVGSTRVAAALNYADFGVADKKSLTFLFGDLVDDLERIRAAQAALCAKLDANHGAATDHAVTIAIPVTSMKVGK